MQLYQWIGWILLMLEEVFANAAITYTFSGGRFGDNLMSYLHAKWISYEYQIPLLYRPFPFSSQLLMDQIEHNYAVESKQFFRHLFLSPQMSKPLIEKEVLYICPYFPESESERKLQPWFFYPVNWKDPTFRTIVKHAITPLSNLSLTVPPQGVVSIALHLRQGGGYDQYKTYFFENPLKIPPLSFYVTALREVLHLFKGYPIYCHIFTDAADPQKLLEELQNQFLVTPLLQFSCRSDLNRHDQNVLEDFFSLFHFDVLIRPESNYSMIPNLLSDYAVVVSPAQYKMMGDELLIHELRVEKNLEQYQEVIGRIHSSHTTQLGL